MQGLLQFKQYGSHKKVHITNLIVDILYNLKSEVEKNNIDFSFINNLEQNLTLYKINTDTFIKQLKDIISLLIKNSKLDEKIQLAITQDAKNLYILIKSNGYLLTLIDCPHNQMFTKHDESSDQPSLKSFLISLKLYKVKYLISKEADDNYCLELQYRIAQ